MVSDIFYFHPYLGKIPILTNIFQMGGSTTNQLRFMSCCQKKSLQFVTRTTWVGATVKLRDEDDETNGS